MKSVSTLQRRNLLDARNTISYGPANSNDNMAALAKIHDPLFSVAVENHFSVGEEELPLV